VTGRRRALILAALALTVPLPALALTGGSGGGLAVSASLNGCGVAGGTIVCGIDASFGGVPEARYITASVTAPDGSVTDFGTVVRGASGSTTLWVPYTGSGTYSVSASAWGVDDSGDPEVIDTDKASAGDDDRVKGVDTTAGGSRGAIAVPGGEEAPADEAEPAPEPELPPCEPAPAPVPPTPDPADGVPDAGGAADGAAADGAGSVDAAVTESAPVTQDTAPSDCTPPDATTP